MTQPPAPEPTPEHVAQFIDRWKRSAASERSNYQLFLAELCDLLDVPRPDPARGTPEQDSYVFERVVTAAAGGAAGATKTGAAETGATETGATETGATETGFIDLYRRGAFVLEAKQGSDAAPTAQEAEAAALGNAPRKRRRGTAKRSTVGWDNAMIAARGQAERYVRALGAEEGNPPFLVVADIGHCLELYADFSRAGKHYLPFPDPARNRVMLEDLARPDVRAMLRTLWLDPMELDPARRSARVTREVADRLARLAKSLEASGHAPATVAAFLMRIIFTMFAEDVELLPRRSFLELLESLKGNTAVLPPMLSALWATMATGGFSPILRRSVLHFNGGLFADTEALPISEEQLRLLIDAAGADWRDVEPAIFGTLVERALDPIERHKLGAHYTPRAYVERLVFPAVIEPIRAEWETARAAAITMDREGKKPEAIAELQRFLRTLAATRVLDPACGTGNFLYVAMEHMKRIEGEALEMLARAGVTDAAFDLTEMTVDPHQFLGIEINPRAAAIADLVLWIGYLQWHFRTHGDAQPRQPVLRQYHNIECRDALLAYDRAEPVLTADGRPATRWDGRTTKTSPITGEQIPDETATVPVLRYINPCPAAWPEAEYIVGNPPFIGDKVLKQTLGVGYAAALRTAYPAISESTDLVLYWWAAAAELVRTDHVRRFGFITTNSVRQAFNRRVLQDQLSGSPNLSIVFAIPDHPWIDTIEGAAVRIAMTVGIRGTAVGLLQHVIAESTDDSHEGTVTLSGQVGTIHADLTCGADVAATLPLQSNDRLSCVGVKLFGQGFILDEDDIQTLLRDRNESLRSHIRRYRIGRDISGTSQNLFVLDFLGVSEADLRDRFPTAYQWLLERVKPERDQNNRDSYRRLWWIFGEPRKQFRPALSGLNRYIATLETSKHRFFVFLDGDILPEGSLVAIALDDAYALGILSSRVHVTWALAAGGRLGVGNDPRYNKTRCFDPFPFPDATEEQKARIRELGERLDAHRKRQQALHPALTITGMYNVLEKLRAGEHLTAKEKTIHEQGLVSVLKEIHDALDAAVLAAYGWPAALSDAEILERLVALNAERAREEAEGLIRWLRPAFQNPKGAPGTAMQFEGMVSEPIAPYNAETGRRSSGRGTVGRGTGERTAAAKAPWPGTIREQTQAVRAALAELTAPATAEELAARFTGARKARVREILEALADLGGAHELPDGRFAP